MALVDYSDSDSEEAQAEASSPTKKRRVSKGDSNDLPPLPASFLDQYSSTVRTSTGDDPSLHGGRKRVTPHIEGNWPTHVYLEWHPTPKEHELLSALVKAHRPPVGTESKQLAAKDETHSLLLNELGVPLPLHISLSRPLVLKTGQKDAFLTRLRHAINENAAKAITTQSKDLAWHPNENNTRWFLVIRLKLSAELSKLLDICNGSVKEHGQPLLYAEGGKSGGDEFHISIAWSLKCPTMDDVKDRKAAVPVSGSDAGIPYRLLEQLSALQIEFKEVKVRIGQDVNLIALKSRR